MASPADQAHVLLRLPLEQLLVFLALEERARLLGTCRALWRDARLAAFAARLTPRVTQHLRRGCASDWAAIAPGLRFFRDRREGWRFCSLEAAHSHRDVGCGETEWDARLLSAVAFVQTRLSRWCYSPVSLMCAVDDLVEGRRYSDARFVCRPLLVRLPTLPPASEWTRQEVAAALESVHAGLGAALRSAEPPGRADDLLGHHWGGISATQSGEARCALCDWREHVLVEYAKLRPEMLSFGTDDRHRRQAEEDAILRFMLSEGGVGLPAHLRERAGFDWELRKMVYCALSWYHRRQCETFYRPLKRTLERSGLRFVTLADATWAAGAGAREQQSAAEVQLMAGVSAAGHLVGLYRLKVSAQG